jgi:hypothetical protein
MKLQSHQEWLQDIIDKSPNYGYELVGNKSYSVEDKGDILFVGGCVEIHEGVAELWSILSSDAIRRQGSFITRGIRDYLNMLQLEHGYHRLFTLVEASFVEGHRWAQILGFKMEAVLKKYRPDKRDVAVYVRL